MTPLDQAHAAGGADRLPFFQAFAATELFVLLTGPAEGDQIAPEVFETEAGSYLLAFDLEDRLTAFVGGPAPYAALSGRALAEMLAGQGVGVALNPEVAPSSELLPPEALDWLRETLGAGPDELSARPVELAPPGALPEALLTALDARFAAAAGLARLAYLTSATYEGGARGHLLMFIDAAPGAEAALARAVSEVLALSGLEAGWLDVGFVAASDPMAARLARVALRFDLPEPEAPKAPSAPGMDPDAPPKLR